MILTAKIQKAINMSAVYHRTHERIGLKFPYIVHPFSVALIASEYTNDEDVFCAALLHDVVEDSVGYGFEHLSLDFGPNVARIVQAITEDKTGSDSLEVLRQNWKVRKQKYLEKLHQAPQEALIVCAADSIHNLKSLMETYKMHGESFWNSFGSSLENKLVFYGKVVAFMEAYLSIPITKKLSETYTEALQTLKPESTRNSSTTSSSPIFPLQKANL